MRNFFRFISRILTFLLADILLSSIADSTNCISFDLDKITCIRCDNNFILTEGICQPSSNEETFTNCIEKSIYGDCMVCECGFSFNSESNTCIRTPPGISGCQEFSASNESICYRPKEDYELLKWSNGTFESIQFSQYSHCEIRSADNGECERCHSGYVLKESPNTTSDECTKASHAVFNSFYTFFTKPPHKLVSRDVRFTVLSNGVYPIINDCIKHRLYIPLNPSNTSLPHARCEKCSAQKITNESQTVCVRIPFPNCQIVYDNDLKTCKQCSNPSYFTIYNNSQCLLRTYIAKMNPSNTNSITPKRFDRCLEYSKHSDGCLRCNLGFTLVSSKCALPNEILSVLQRLKQSPKMTNCKYAITLLECFECYPGFIRDTIGACREISTNLDPHCDLVDLDGGCFHCLPKYYLDNYRQCKQMARIGCVEESITNPKECVECQSGFYLDSNKICQFYNNFCEETDGIHPNCLLCKNLNYLVHTLPTNVESVELGDSMSHKTCISISHIKNCLLSDGMTDKCLICHRLFLITPNKGCIPNIQHDGTKCESSLAYLHELTNPNQVGSQQQFECRLHDFHNFELCVSLHKTENRCLKCFHGFYLGSDGGCYIIEDCSLSNGIDKICLQASELEQYIAEDGWTIHNTKYNCQSNRRDDICSPCYFFSSQNNFVEVGIWRGDDKNTCISLNEIPPSISQNCINISLVEESVNHEPDSASNNQKGSTYKCILCQNLFYLNSSGICERIFESIQDSCQLSDGLTNACLFCRIHDFFEFGFIFTLNTERMVCEKAYGQSVEFCISYDSDRNCIQCQNLYYLTSIDQSQVCLPIPPPNCLLSNGIISSCQKCDTNYYLNLEYHLCLKDPFCETFHPLTNSCLACLPGFNLTNGYFCISNNDLQCLKKNQIGDCEECREGYYLNTQNSRLKCFKIMQPNCLQIHMDRCILCKENYILTDTLNCLPENDRCLSQPLPDSFRKAYGVLACFACKPQYFHDSRYKTCEIIENCERIEKNTCALCKRGFYIDTTDPNRLNQCKKVHNCEDSFGIYNLCLRCEPGYTFNKFFCFPTNPIEYCIEYSEVTCIRCTSLYFLSSSEKPTCQRIETFEHCQFSDGIKNQCELCEYTKGFILEHSSTTTTTNSTKPEKCVQLDNCQISNGVDTCIKCIRGFFATTTIDVDDNSNRISTCNAHPIIENCVEYAYYEFGCQECRNFYYLSEDARSCEPFSEQAQQNCILSDGIKPYCKFCKPRFAIFTESPLSSETSCQSIKFPIEGCQSYENKNMIFCNNCLFEYYISRTNSNNNSNVLECIFKQHQPHHCTTYGSEQELDTCIACDSGYRLSSGFTCEALEEFEKVQNCSEYESNSNICKACTQLEVHGQEFVSFWLNKADNTCIDVSRLMCELFDQKSMTCIQFHIPKCALYTSNIPSDLPNQIRQCIHCEQAFYLSEQGLCLQHNIIEFCIEYDPKIPNECRTCQLHYMSSRDRKECVKRKIANCIMYSESQDTCEKCASKFSFDIPTGECVAQEIPNCIRTHRSFSGNHSSERCQQCFWNRSYSPENNSCERISVRNPHCISYMKSTSPIDRIKCTACDSNSFLNDESICIRIRSRCILPKCIQESVESTAEIRTCQTCSDGYKIDRQSQQCILQIKTNDDPSTTDPEIDSKKKNSNEESQGQLSNESSIDSVNVILIILIILFITSGIAFVVVIKYKHRIIQCIFHREDLQLIQHAGQINSIEFTENIS